MSEVGEGRRSLSRCREAEEEEGKGRKGVGGGGDPVLSSGRGEEKGKAERGGEDDG